VYSKTRNPGLRFLKPENPGLEKCSRFGNPNGGIVNKDSTLRTSLRTALEILSQLDFYFAK